LFDEREIEKLKLCIATAVEGAAGLSNYEFIERRIIGKYS